MAYGHVIRIGEPNGRIAVYLDESAAWDVYHAFHYEDGFAKDLAKAIVQAYPKGRTIMVKRNLEVFIRDSYFVRDAPIGFARDTYSYKWVAHILWLQIGILK